MKIRKKTLISNIIHASDNFALLRSIEDVGSFLYEFNFFVDIKRALTFNANIIKISIKKNQTVDKPDVFTDMRNSGDVKSLLQNILSLESQTHDLRLSSKSEIVATSLFDLTTKFDNNSSKNSLKEKNVSTQKVIDLISVEDLKKRKIEPAVLQTVNKTKSKQSSGKAQSSAYDLLSYGVDPSIAALNYNNVISTADSIAGTGAKLTSGILDTKNSLTPVGILRQNLIDSAYTNQTTKLSSHLDLANDTLVPVLIDVPIKYVLSSKLMRLPASIGNEDFFVIFELLDNNGVVHETVIKKVQHNIAIKILNTPRQPPRVFISAQQKQGKNILEIEQIDNFATRIKILRRKISNIEVEQNNSKYENVAEIPLTKDNGSVKFIDNVGNSSTIVYRCISIGRTGIQSSEFTNVVAMPVKSAVSNKLNRSYAASLFVKTIEGGNSIVVTSIPVNVIAVAVMRKNLSIFEQKYSYINAQDKLKFVGPSLGNLSFLDSNVKDDTVYQYTCLLLYKDGTEAFSTASAIKKYTTLSIGSVNVSVSNLEVIKDNSLDVRFELKSTINSNSLSQTYELLKKQKIDDLYTDELINERNQLQQLIAHYITRIDLTSGKEESFGVFTGSNFSDMTVGKQNNVSKLQPGHKYRYVISTLTRDPETLLKDYRKSTSDTTTGKLYGFKPSIFRHPVTLKKGTIVTKESLMSNHPEDEFLHGNIGNTHEIDVTFESNTPKILNANALKVNQETCLIQWTVDGSLELIDHFIIVKEILGHSSIVGKSHNNFSGKTIEFYDNITINDVGELSYKIIPVFCDYSRGTEITTNKIRINDMRKYNG